MRQRFARGRLAVAHEANAFHLVHVGEQSWTPTFPIENQCKGPALPGVAHFLDELLQHGDHALALTPGEHEQRITVRVICGPNRRNLDVLAYDLP